MILHRKSIYNLPIESILPIRKITEVRIYLCIIYASTVGAVFIRVHIKHVYIYRTALTTTPTPLHQPCEGANGAGQCARVRVGLNRIAETKALRVKPICTCDDNIPDSIQYTGFYEAPGTTGCTGRCAVPGRLKSTIRLNKYQVGVPGDFKPYNIYRCTCRDPFRSPALYTHLYHYTRWR